MVLISVLLTHTDYESMVQNGKVIIRDFDFRQKRQQTKFKPSKIIQNSSVAENELKS